MIKIDHISEPIAEDWWSYQRTGKDEVSQIAVGRPRPSPGDANGDWYCPVSIEHFTTKIIPVVGVGPVDALANAMTLVSKFRESVGSVTPRAKAR